MTIIAKDTLPRHSQQNIKLYGYALLIIAKLIILFKLKYNIIFQNYSDLKNAQKKQTE